MEQEVRIEKSEDDPKLVIGCEQYPLHDRCWDIELVYGKSNCILTFYWKGEVKLSIRYEQGRDSVWARLEAFLFDAYAAFRSSAPKLSHRLA